MKLDKGKVIVMNEEYQEIDLMELAQRILQRWMLIVLLTAIAAGVSYGVTKYRLTPIYEASTTVFIGKDSSEIMGLDIMDFEMGQALVTDYQELIQTNLITEQVVKDLALLGTKEDIQAGLNVEAVKDSRFMRISFKDPSPEMAVKVADKLSVVLTKKAVDIVGVKNIQIVDFAELPKAPISPSTSKNVAVAGILGMMLALFIIFVELMMANTIEKEEDVEKELGLPVLGVIPKFAGEDRT